MYFSVNVIGMGSDVDSGLLKYLCYQHRKQRGTWANCALSASHVCSNASFSCSQLKMNRQKNSFQKLKPHPQFSCHSGEKWRNEIKPTRGSARGAQGWERMGSGKNARGLQVVVPLMFSDNSVKKSLDVEKFFRLGNTGRTPLGGTAFRFIRGEY